MIGKTCFVAMNGPTNITRNSSSNLSAGNSSSGDTNWSPALLTRMSIRLQAATARSIAAASCSSRVTSHCTPNACPPAPLIIPAAASAALPSRSATHTRAPSRAKSSAIRKPIPLPAPVTNAMRPSSVPLLPIAPPSKGTLHQCEKLADDAAPEAEHADDEPTSGENGDPRAVGRQIVLQSCNEKRSDGRTDRCPHAAEQRHEDNRPRTVPVHVGQRRRLKDESLHRAGQTGDSRGDDEGHEFVAVDVVPKGNRARLVLVDRA